MENKIKELIMQGKGVEVAMAIYSLLRDAYFNNGHNLYVEQEYELQDFLNVMGFITKMGPTTQENQEAIFSWIEWLLELSSNFNINMNFLDDEEKIEELYNDAFWIPKEQIDPIIKIREEERQKRINEGKQSYRWKIREFPEITGMFTRLLGIGETLSRNDPRKQITQDAQEVLENEWDILQKAEAPLPDGYYAWMQKVIELENTVNQAAQSGDSSGLTIQQFKNKITRKKKRHPKKTTKLL